ncbi:hypothetical protein J5N97_001694 [Dioscorea zingiberensis]|uniref:Secreted protein n=1 Tax=Dioscorea zingiberensis TaxID=325984 RepID=A0A9D5BVL8_9LILI|nr:hypothetical protein J5N97_001694 [Dioscorea zingiberensis]
MQPLMTILAICCITASFLALVCAHFSDSGVYFEVLENVSYYLPHVDTPRRQKRSEDLGLLYIIMNAPPSRKHLADGSM